MRIIISHVYSSHNKGDAALLSVLLSDVRRAFNNPEVTILTIDKIQPDEIFEGAPLKNAFMYDAINRYRSPVLRALYSLFVMASTLLYAYMYRLTKRRLLLPKNIAAIADLYQKADLIIPVGGGYIRSKPGFINTVRLFFIVHPLIFTSLLGKPTIGYTQSIGPFGSKVQEVIGKFVVKKMDGIIVREKISLQLLEKWGVTKNVFLSVDGGFLFTSDAKKDIREELSIPQQRLMVGITVRSWLKPREQKNYEMAVAKLADYIIAKHNAVVVFIPQVTVEHHRDDDREVSKSVYGFMEYKYDARILTEHYDHRTIKSIYANLDYLVGTRFHSVIFSLTSYVPSIAIEYEHKTGGIMADLGLEQWTINIRQIEAGQLMKLFDQLVAGRDAYINQLKKALLLYKERAEQSIYFIKEVYGNIKVK